MRRGYEGQFSSKVIDLTTHLGRELPEITSRSVQTGKAVNFATVTTQIEAQLEVFFFYLKKFSFSSQKSIYELFHLHTLEVFITETIFPYCSIICILAQIKLSITLHESTTSLLLPRNKFTIQRKTYSKLKFQIK